MSADLTIPLILIAHKALEMGPRKYVEASQPNPADTCACGAEAEHTEYRGGHEIGVCADCK